MLKLIGLFVVTAGLDRLLSHLIGAPGVILCEPATIATITAVSAAVTATTAVAAGTLNYIQSQEAADAARSLKNQQQSALDAQARAAAQEASVQAISGQTFGKEDPTAKAVSTGLGFGSGNAPMTNAGGRAQLTAGMS